MKDKEFQHLLLDLLNSVVTICIKGLANKRFESEEILYYKTEVFGFDYDDDGPHYQGWEPKLVTKAMWNEAVLAVGQETKKLDAYNKVAKYMCDIYNMDIASSQYYLGMLVNLVSFKIFQGEINDYSELEPYTLSFLKYHNKQNVNYSSSAYHRNSIAASGCSAR
ncbi:hypothetical protein ACFLW8_00800 [Chloroflexota bacterium]